MYEFTRLKLTQDEFDNLVSMREPSWWPDLNKYPLFWDKERYPENFIAAEQDFLSSLCGSADSYV